nr:hypothetical protein [Tanacetum cinerariifolium]
KEIKGKNILENGALMPKPNVIAPRIFKLDLEPLAPKVLKNKDAHINYIMDYQKHADILREIVKNARALSPLDSNLDSASMASEQFCSRPGPQLMTPGIISSGLVPNPPSPTPYVPPTKKNWDILFQPIFDEYFNPPPCVASLVPTVIALVPADSTGSPSSTPIDQDAPSLSTSQTPQKS